MKKAKLILSAIALLAVVGGAFAFKASRFTGNKVYYTTNQLQTVTNGKTYSTFTIGAFCVSSANDLWIRAAGEGFTSTVYRPTAIPAPTTIVATATDGSGFTTSITTYSCPATYTTLVTLAN